MLSVKIEWYRNNYRIDKNLLKSYYKIRNISNKLQNIQLDKKKNIIIDNKKTKH